MSELYMKRGYLMENDDDDRDTKIDMDEIDDLLNGDKKKSGGAEKVKKLMIAIAEVIIHILKLE